MTQEEMVAVGRVLKVRGAKGELTFLPLTDEISRFSLLKEVFIEKTDGSTVKKEIEKIFFYKGKGVIKFNGVNSGKEAGEFLKAYISIPEKERMQLPENHYFISDLLGASVITLEGEEIGKLTDVFATKSNDVYVVTGKGEEKLIPAIKDVIKEVNIKDKKIIINLIQGL